MQSQAALLQYPSIAMWFNVGGGCSIPSCRLSCGGLLRLRVVQIVGLGLLRLRIIRHVRVRLSPSCHSTDGHWALGFLHLHVTQHGGARFSMASYRSTLRRWVVAPLRRPKCRGWGLELLFVREVGSRSLHGWVVVWPGAHIIWPAWFSFRLPCCCLAVLVVVIAI